MTIRRLPEGLVNRIAAGEVVERPASAVKELVENAIDAGARRIDVALEDGGRALIAVADDGCGMTAAEMALAVERHATSKLPDDDLARIAFLGFRGEALPSIAAVSRLSITSRAGDAPDAWLLTVEGGEKRAPQPAAFGRGTRIEVRDLFYATPARLKFLKSPRSETQAAGEVLNQLAMAHPDIAFSLTTDGRASMRLDAGQGDLLDVRLKRLSAVMGRDFADNAVPIDAEREGIRLTGYAGLPTYNRGNGRLQFGFVNGWERPNYYGPLDAPETFDHDARSFRRGDWWQYAVEEAKAIREGVGLIDATAFTKHVVKGPGATRFLDWFTCNKLPKVGRINLTYALTAHGTTRTEYTIVRNGEDSYYLVSAGAWTEYDADFLRKAAADKMGEFGYIEIQDVTTQWGVFAIAGPKSRDVLREVVKDADPDTVLSNKRFPWLSARKIELGMCPVNAIRVAYTGELGWELHHPIEMQNYLFDLLETAGAKHGMKLVGARAQNWLRQEKSYRAFGNELGRDATPLEADLPRFVDMDKDYHGKQAMLDTGVRAKCVTLLIDGPEDADPWGREALYDGDTKVGRLTSGGYSVAFGKSIGMGYVRPDLAVPGTRLKVKMFDRLWEAEIAQDSPYDPTNAAIRKDG